MSTLRMHLLAHVQARHDYFADGLARAMRFEPSSRCTEWLRAFEMVLRASDHAMALHVPEHRLVDLAAEAQTAGTPVTLDFTALSRDPTFGYYTEDPTPQAIHVQLTENGADHHQTLQWHSRQSIWCYWLLGDWEDKVLAIIDTTGRRNFDAVGRLPLGDTDARQAHCFRSRTPLALAERAPAGLQLRAGPSATTTRTVIAQLPAPRPQALQYELGPNGRQAVAEIFVSR